MFLELNWNDEKVGYLFVIDTFPSIILKRGGMIIVVSLSASGNAVKVFINQHSVEIKTITKTCSNSTDQLVSYAVRWEIYQQCLMMSKL